MKNNAVTMKRLVPPFSASLALFVLKCVAVVLADIGANQLCSLYTFVPFTDNGTSAESMLGNDSNPGFAFMAAALLAMQHFNDRDATVVAQLDSIALRQCDVRFDMDHSLFFDTGSVGHSAARTYYLQANAQTPCAIAGPFTNDPATDLAVLAEASHVPMVAQRSYDVSVVSDGEFTSMMFPTPVSLTQITLQFMQRHGRNNYTAIVYPSSDLGVQLREMIVVELERQDVRFYTSNYLPPRSTSLVDVSTNRTIRTALAAVQSRGYRTVLVVLENADLELPAIADAADELNMNNGDYFWLWFGPFSFRQLYAGEPNVVKLLFGSAWLSAIDPFLLTGDHPFEDALEQQGPDFANLMNSYNPIQKHEPGYVYAPPNYFNTSGNLEFGQTFMYDAIMSIGIGACLARRGENGSITSEDHVVGIRQAVFDGASGQVALNTSGEWPGARLASGAMWAAFNFVPVLPVLSRDSVRLADVYYPSGGTGWISPQPFIFADGTFTPPLLRDTANAHYLQNGLRIMGLCLFGSVVVAAVATLVWIYLNRNHRVLRAAQPHFLYCLAFGTIISASAIFTLSFDEGAGWTATQLSACCKATPWLVVLGYVFIYSALFTKLHRVNKVLQFTRRIYSIHQASLPAIFFIMATLVVLTVWTVCDGLYWERVIIDTTTGESIGLCQSDHMTIYIVCLAIVAIIPMFLTGVMAWKTRDVDEAYSESSWIFAAIVCQLELTALAFPVITILRSLSSDGRYVGFVIVFWLFPTSTLLLIMLPKVLAFRHSQSVCSPTSTSIGRTKRGERGKPRISGLNSGLENQRNVISSIDEPSVLGETAKHDYSGSDRNYEAVNGKVYKN